MDDFAGWLRLNYARAYRNIPVGSGAGFQHAVSCFATGLQGLIAVSGPVLFVVLVLAHVGLLGRAGYRVVRRRPL